MFRAKAPKRPALREERRREARFECPPAIVHAHLDGCEERVHARVKEISRVGLQLHADVPWEIGTRVTIELPDETIHGEIRHCDLQPDLSWTVGVHIRL